MPFINMGDAPFEKYCIPNNDPCEVLVDGFPSHYTEKEIRKLLESVGQIRGFRLLTDSSSCEGAAYVLYQNESVANTACAVLNGVTLDGRALIVRRFGHRALINLKPRPYSMSEPFCCICIDSPKGQPIFTAECSHQFHYSCIANNVEYGNLYCPVCKEEWNKNNVPFQVSSPNRARKSVPSTMPSTSADDEPFESSCLPLESPFYPNVTYKFCAEGISITHIESCVICSHGLKIQEAIFTAKCSHQFHYPCIANNVKHGNLNCPVCRTKWDTKNAPFQVAPPKSAMLHRRQQRGFRQQVPPNNQHEEHPAEPSTFDDDEPLKSSFESSPHENVTTKTCLDRAAIASVELNTEIPVLLTIRGPPLHESGRMSIDLVIILDARSSMGCKKIDCVKRAAKIVLENLASSDRLSIVSLSSTSRRVLPLQRMTDDGRESAILAIDSLETGGVTSIEEALKKGTKVLEDRQDRNPVACIMLFSNGFDDHIYRSSSRISPSIFPVHTFGFNNERNLQDISDASVGTYSLIKSVVNQTIYIGQLLSVVANDLSVNVCAASSNVKIMSISSARHVSKVSDVGNEGVVNIKNIHAEEEVHLLIYLSVQPSGSSANTPLLDVTCTYRDPATDKWMHVVCSPAETEASFEIDPKRAKIKTSESIASAQKLAEMGDMKGASALLAEQRDAMLASSEAAGDGFRFKYEIEKLEQKIALVDFCCTDIGRAYAPDMFKNRKESETRKERRKILRGMVNKREEKTEKTEKQK